MGNPRRTPSKVMMTMNILMAANTPPRCSTNTKSIHKASPTLRELTASKSGTQCITNTSSTILPVLQEIPTRISLEADPTAAIVDLPKDNDEQYQNTCPHLSTTMVKIPNIFSSSAPYDYHAQLAAITAECEQMQQCWSLPAAVIDLPNDNDDR